MIKKKLRPGVQALQWFTSIISNVQNEALHTQVTLLCSGLPVYSIASRIYTPEAGYAAPVVFVGDAGYPECFAGWIKGAQ